jgi:3-oxoacyl-[acyl-carrier-protein] synthase-1
MEEKTPFDLKNVYVASDNIISSLGFTTEENGLTLESNVTGIRLHENELLSRVPFWASMADRSRLDLVFSEIADLFCKEGRR